MKYILSILFTLFVTIGFSQKRITVSAAKLKGLKDAAAYFQKEVDEEKPGAAITFVLAHGVYNFLTPFIAHDKTVNFIGGGNTPGLYTHFWYYNDSLPAFSFTRKDYGTTAHIQNIKISAAGGNKKASTQHGIVLRVPTTLKDCLIENFGGNGLDMHGSVSEGTDVSFSEISKVVIRSCGGDGVYIRGGDANACTFYMIDVRDNVGWGINDASFLGNTWLSCMAHLNGVDTWLLERKDWKGNYTASDINNRSTFSACYSEGGSPPSVFGGSSFVAGGLIGYNRFTLINWAMGISDGNYFDDPDRGRQEHILKAPYDRTETYIREYMGYYPTSLEAKNYQ